MGHQDISRPVTVLGHLDTSWRLLQNFMNRAQSVSCDDSGIGGTQQTKLIEGTRGTCHPDYSLGHGQSMKWNIMSWPLWNVPLFCCVSAVYYVDINSMTYFLQAHWGQDKMLALSNTISYWFKFTLTFVPQDLIDNISALVQLVSWYGTGNKPLGHPMMAQTLLAICLDHLEDL